MAVHQDRIERLGRIVEVMEKEAHGGIEMTAPLLLERLAHHYPSPNFSAALRAVQRDLSDLEQRGDIVAWPGRGKPKRYRLVDQGSARSGPRLAREVASGGTGESIFLPVPAPCLQARIVPLQADFKPDEPIDLALRVRGYVTDLLRDKPLGERQRMEREDAGSAFDARVYARVPGSGHLLRWLLAAGDGIEVLKPPGLRALIASQARRMNALYSSTQG